MAIISRKYKYLFLMQPRTACSATGHLLINHFEGEYLPSKDILYEDGTIRVQKKHSTLHDLLNEKLLSLAEVNDLFIFTTIRNPFDSLVSIFLKKHYKANQYLYNPKKDWVYKIPGYAQDVKFCASHTFAEWIEHQFASTNLKQQFKRLIGRHSPWVLPKRLRETRFTLDSDFVMRFENLQADLEHAMKQCGAKDIPEVPRGGSTPGKESGYRSYYTPRAKRLVEGAWAGVLYQYGYAF